LPGGPYKITDGRRSASIARRKSLPGARICSWPTNSSSERGRIRVASGAALFADSTSCASSNRSCTRENTLLERIVHLIVATTLQAIVVNAPRLRHYMLRAWHCYDCSLHCKRAISENC